MKKIALVSLLLGLSACGEAPVVPDVTLMTFNVQNLFDNIDDPGKDDKAYLPLAGKQSAEHIAACNEIAVDSWRDECLDLDWSDAAIELKLGVIADAIRQIDGGPDIIALQEIENVEILERLRDEFLGDLGYVPAILVEGQDTRGIDVAFLTRLPLVGEPVLHPMRFADHPEREGDTRGILQATFELPDGERLTGFAVHFPAPFHPTTMREAAYHHLSDLRAQVPDDHAVFAAGDFNTTSAEVRGTGILDRLARPHWIIAHELGCGECRGTSYYARDDSWSFLDMILFTPARGEKTTWQLRADSVRVAQNRPAQVTSAGTPARFRLAEGTGVSDHWPLVVTLQATRKQ